MAPFRAVGGVDRGAAAIERFTDTADQFSEIVEEMPESARWQALLLLYDMQETEFVQTMVASVTQLSQSSSRLAETAEKLPERLRKETSILIEQIDAKQDNLQVTFEKAEKSAAALERAAAKVGEAADSMQGVSKGITETAGAWEAAAKSTTQLLEEYGKVAPPDGEKPPFKIEDYKETAEATAMTAIELRGLVTDMREMAKAGELSEYGSTARALMNDITWRLAGLLLTMFVLAAIYRTVFGRATRASRADRKE
jgi:septal ring factor EnvC (AmiA/AmiB activator)